MSVSDELQTNSARINKLEEHVDFLKTKARELLRENIALRQKLIGLEHPVVNNVEIHSSSRIHKFNVQEGQLCTYYKADEQKMIFFADDPNIVEKTVISQEIEPQRKISI